jgi:hypothetical protein
MSTLLLLTNALQPSVEVLPGLSLLGHQVRILPSEGSALLEAPDADLLLVDGRLELAHARDLCRLIRTTGTDIPVLLIVTDGGLSVVAHDWGMHDVVLHTAGPAELEGRIRLAIGRMSAQRDADDPEAHVIRSGEVVVDDASYTAKPRPASPYVVSSSAWCRSRRHAPSSSGSSPSAADAASEIDWMSARSTRSTLGKH